MTDYTSSYSNWIPQIISIAKEAANAVLAIYQTNFDVQIKLDKSPVTVADLASHTIIKKGLNLFSPSIPVLSEEGTGVSFSERSQWSRYWLIDPLDGTEEFIQKTHEFTINIALIEKEQPVLGVVFVPVLDECYWAIRGSGAYLQSKDNPPTIIKSNDFPPRGPLKIIVSRHYSAHQKELNDLQKKIGNYELVYCGSALKICLIARGDVDFYPRFGRTSEWDTAAGQCILEAAGGSLVDFAGQTLHYNTKESLLNPAFYAMSSSKLFDMYCG